VNYALIRGDALRIPLRDASVDAIITSPPYFALRSYQDDGEHYDGQIGSEATPADFLAALWAVSDECYRVLKPTGSMFVDLGDKYAGSGGHNNSGLNTDAYWRGHNWDETRDAPKSYNKARDVTVKSLMGLPWRYALGLSCPDPYRNDAGPQWTLRAEIVWSKPNGLPESVTDRVRRSHETWFHFTKGPRYYAAVDEIREGHTGTTHPQAYRSMTSGGGETHRVGGTDGSTLNPLGKLPGSVWTIPSEPLTVPDHIGVDHFAAFPQEWPRRLILGWTPSGICTACNEGRRPVVEKRAVKSPAHAEGSIVGRRTAPAGEQAASVDRGDVGAPRFNQEHTITGYACACDVTLAPTRPAVVLDPFVGTGTVPMVARALGRYGIGLDLSRDYLRLARWRIGESRHGSKTIDRTNRERQGNLW
jgi:DNA modification methylase